MDKTRRAMTTIDDRRVALYHVVLPHEGFEESARALVRLVRPAQEMNPGGRRTLFLDIEEHREADGRSDADMRELQQAFLLDVLAPCPGQRCCQTGAVTNQGFNRSKRATDLRQGLVRTARTAPRYVLASQSAAPLKKATFHTIPGSEKYVEDDQ